jgi:hypothetical protein
MVSWFCSKFPCLVGAKQTRLLASPFPITRPLSECSPTSFFKTFCYINENEERPSSLADRTQLFLFGSEFAVVLNGMMGQPLLSLLNVSAAMKQMNVFYPKQPRRLNMKIVSFSCPSGQHIPFALSFVFAWTLAGAHKSLLLIPVNANPFFIVHFLLAHTFWHTTGIKVLCSSLTVLQWLCETYISPEAMYSVPLLTSSMTYFPYIFLSNTSFLYSPGTRSYHENCTSTEATYSSRLSATIPGYTNPAQ